MLSKAKAIASQIVEWRRDFHMYPELAFEEYRTAERVEKELKVLGYRVRTGIGETGVVGEIGYGSPVVAIRADMDALPIEENNDVPYRSTRQGLMHACGHDAHIAIGLATATLIRKEEFPGTIRFIFQPAEEESDENGISGAQHMIGEGVMDGVEAVIALHVDSAIKAGEIRTRSGAITAGVDTFYTTILGKGGHSSTPDRVIDPIFIASHVILALNGIVSRRIDPLNPAVLSIGTIHGGTVHNVIPEKVKFTGTIRYMDLEVQKKIHEEFDRTLEIACALGGDFENYIEIGYPPGYNHNGVVDLIEEVCMDFFGEDIDLAVKPEMGAEDFGFFTKLAPGAIFYLGCRIDGDVRRHHDPRFDIDESCLPVGAATLAEVSLRILRDGYIKKWKEDIR